MEVEIGKLIAQYGLPTALVVFFIWRDSRREAQYNETIRRLDEYIRGELADLTRSCSNTMAAFSRAVERRPCLAQERERIMEEKKTT